MLPVAFGIFNQSSILKIKETRVYTFRYCMIQKSEHDHDMSIKHKASLRTFRAGHQVFPVGAEVKIHDGVAVTLQRGGQPAVGEDKVVGFSASHLGGSLLLLVLLLLLACCLICLGCLFICGDTGDSR